MVLWLVHPICFFSSLLHDSLHSLFTPVCLSVTRQGALHVLKGIPQLVNPSSQGWGARSFPASRQHTVSFFFGAFLFVIVLLAELPFAMRMRDIYAYLRRSAGMHARSSSNLWCSSACKINSRLGGNILLKSKKLLRQLSSFLLSFGHLRSRW